MSDVKKFPTKPYFDDFAEDKNFLRVLFRPGYVIQTRELNQLQTILQNQIGTLADYSIPDGSSVIGGKASLVNKLPFIKLATGTTFLKPLNDYEGLKFVAANGVEGTVKFAVAAAGANPATLYVKYDKSAPTSQLPANGDVITITHEDTSTELVTVAPTAATGNAAAVILSPGIFYVNKSFVRTDDQLLLINRYNTVIADDDISVGFYVRDEVIRPEQDISLLDNATGAPSETSPGAHRYKCSVVLANKESLSDAQLASYKELMKIRFGKVAAKPRTDSDVTVLEQILARRTYDQAGDYIVDDFIIDVREHLTTNSKDRGVYTAAEGGSESKMVYEFDKGVAYVRGYEINTEGNAQVVVNKARTTSTISNALVQTQYNNAFFCYNLVGVPQMSAKIDLYVGATIRGTAFIRAAEYYESKTISSVLENVYRIDVLGAKFNAGYSWQNITEIRHNASVSGAPFSALVNSYVLSPAANRLVYNLPKPFASAVLPRVSFFNKELTVASSSGTITVPAANANETFDDERSSYMLQHPSHNGGEPVRPLSVNIVGTSAVLNVSDTFGSGSVPDIKLIVKTFTSAPTIRTKTFVPAQVNSGVASATLITLSKADVTRIVSVITSGGVNVTNSYELLSNVKDTHYERSQIKLKSGETLPAGTLTITFSYFEHSASGDFFTADSYSGIPYNDIPTYTMSNGERIFMGSAVDYRQRITSSGALEKVGRHSFVTNDQLILDETFYLPRMDRVVLTHLGQFIALTGTPSSTPVLKPEINNAITLYTIYVPPYTFSTRDLVIKQAKHKRFTMKDIAKIENRVDNIEEVTLLNSLERDVQKVDFKDRFKSGFIADNFASQNGADTQNRLHRCAYDLRDAGIRPRNMQNPIDLNRVTSSGMTYHADGVGTLSYTQKPMISQNLGSTIIRIQPYILYDWIGSMTLTPSSDIWFDHRSYLNTNVNGSFWSSQQVDNDWLDEDGLLGSTWHFAGSSWRTGGGDISDRDETAALNMMANATGMNTGTTTTTNVGRRWVSHTVTTSTVNSITVNRSVSAIPFIRPRVVKFEVSGMKPGTRVYPFFANVPVSQYCSHNINSWGTPLYVAGNGTCVGYFNIPANTFMTGVREFVLKDVEFAAEEHDTTRASKEYTAKGTLIIDTATVNVSRTSKTYWYDPLAQSFFIDENTNPGGAFIKSIDVYFGPDVSPATNRYDVVCEIRPMVNGYPGSAVIASTTVDPSKIFGSVNGYTPTRMEFTSPVYLNSGIEYCFVLLSGNDKITVWGSTLGERAYRPTDVSAPSGEIISKQPYLGSLFKSQNSTTWTADQTQDLKFVINKCEFGSSGSVTYRNGINPNQVDTKSNVYKRALVADPLRFTSGSKGIGVVAWGHGFQVGDVVTFSKPDAATAGPYHGIPHTELFNVPLTVTAVSDGAFAVEVSTTSAVSTGSGGGSNIKANWAIDFSYAELITDNFVAPGASLDYTLRAKRKAAYGAGLSSTMYNLEEGDIVDLKETYVCKASDDSGLQLTVSVNSDSRNISPVINEDRMMINVTKNIVNNTPFLDENGNQHWFPSPAAYVQHTVQLETPSNELRVIVDANMPAGTSINAYYKVSQTTISDDDPWIKLPVDGNLVYTDNPDEFREQKFIKEFETEYSTFKVMIQMVSSNPIRVPRLKNYRALALAT